MRSFVIPLSLILAVFDSDAFVSALRFPFQVRTDLPSLTRRATTNSTIPITNTGNAQYIANITLADQELRVIVDTGSSDLWVNFPGTVPSTTDTGKSLSLSYAIGSASGNIHTATAQFDNFTVKDQAFLLVEDASSFSSNIHNQGYDGLLGLGPNKGSQVYDKLKGDAGDSLITRILQQSSNDSNNFISFLLNRHADPGQSYTGQMTIAEYVPGFENVTSMPEIDVESVFKLLGSDQHWQALTDKNNGIIGPDGNAIQYDSIVPKAPDGQLVAVFDSGFTFSQVPRDVSDAIYGRVQGAVYDSENEWWTVPCGQFLNISFNFGGVNYPVHPLDTVDDNFGVTDANGTHVCIGSFQPITSAFSLLGNYDMIMGMSFMRNVYVVMNFGSWVDGSSDNSDPFMQLLSTTNLAAARNDFVQVRLGGSDTISSSQWSLLSSSEMQHSPVSAEEKKKKYQEMILSRWPYIFVGCLVFVLLVTGFIIWRCCCRKGRKSGGCCGCGGRKGGNTRGLVGMEKDDLRGGKSDSYLPLQEGTFKNNHSTASFNHSTASLHAPGYGGGARDSNYSGFGPAAGGYGAPALRFEVSGRRNALPTTLDRREVGTTSLNNSADISYYTDITLNGNTFSVLIDTGSSDLWVAGSVSGAKNTGKSAGVSYAVGSVSGPINTADLDFGGYKVSDQAYIQVTASDSAPGGQGLIGLGPNTGSNVYQKFQNNTGAAVCNRIFLQNTSTPNYITVNLGRINDPSQNFPGNITIGETLDGLDNIMSEPKLNVTEVSVKNSGNQHFQVLLDEDGLIGPDNQTISITTEVDDTSDTKQATAVFDTGFSLSQVPKSVANAFYSRFDGAEFVNVTNIGATWIVPCNLEVNISFKLGGVRYPIHPLDATLDPSIVGISTITNSAGKESCIGLFQPFSFDAGSNPTYDIILGMSFLRNVYSLFNYGDFITGTNSSARGDPYIQLLTTTDPADAHNDFVNQRLNGVDTTGSQTLGAPSSDDSSSSNKNSNSSSSNRMRTLFIGLAIGAGVLALILFIAAFCLRRRKTAPSAPWTGRSGGTYAQLHTVGGPNDRHLASTPAPAYSQYEQRYDHNGEWGSQLYDPAAPGTYPLSQYPNQTAHAPQHNPRYSNPFER